MSRIALVTGANRGIGLGLVTELLDRGYSVVATCRNPDAATELRFVRTFHIPILILGRAPSTIKNT